MVLFPMRPHIDHTFNYLAAALGLDLTLVNEVSSPYYGNFTLLNEETVQLTVKAILAAARRAKNAGLLEEEQEKEEEEKKEKEEKTRPRRRTRRRRRR